MDQILKKNLAKEFDYNNAYLYTPMLKDQILGKNNSWAIRWYASAFLKDLYTLYPGRSLVFHSGGDGSGMNTGYDQFLDVAVSNTPVNVHPIPVEQNLMAYYSFSALFKRLQNLSIIYRVKRFLKKNNFKSHNKNANI